MKTQIHAFIILFFVSFLSFAQNIQSNFINYQGVASDASGNTISNTAIAVQIALKFGAPTATAIYIETHSPTTDSNGVFSIQIGNGTLVSGVYNPGFFGFNASYITVSLNGLEVGTTELNAVPFALSSLTSRDNLWYGDSTNGFIQNGVTNVVIQGSLGVTPNGGTAPQGAYVNEFSIDASFAGNSDTALPTEKAVKTYVDNEVQTINTTISNLSTVTGINDLSDGKTSPTSVYLGAGSGFSDAFTDRWNVGVGFQTLNFNTSGSFNTAIGYRSLKENTLGNANTAIGLDSGHSITTGNRNTLVGSYTFEDNISGVGNVGLGYGAGSNEAGSNKLYISNTDTSNPLIYGEFDTNILRLNGTTEARSFGNSPTTTDLILGGTSNTTAGDDGIISSDPDYAGSDLILISNDAVFINLDNDDNENGEFIINNGAGTGVFAVTEAGNVFVNGSLVHSSDKRLKRDIETLPYGLKDILKLEPKLYNWKNREEEHKSLGLIAQDVQEVIKEVVTTQDNAQKTLGISYTELIPVLINAIKEQQAQIESLKSIHKNKDTALAHVIERLESLEKVQKSNTSKVKYVASQN